MTRKLTTLGALLALAVTSQPAEASPYVPVIQPPHRHTILPYQQYAVVYQAPLRKQCFYGPTAHVRARLMAARLRAAGAIVSMRCMPLPVLIAPHPLHRPHRVCCVYYHMPRQIKVFRSPFEARLFMARMQSLGFSAYVKTLPILRPLPRPLPRPYPIPIVY